MQIFSKFIKKTYTLVSLSTLVIILQTGIFGIFDNDVVDVISVS